MLLATRHKRTQPALCTASKAGTRFTYPGGMEGWVDTGDMITPRLGIKPTTAWSKVRRPNRCVTETPKQIVNAEIASWTTFWTTPHQINFPQQKIFPVCWRRIVGTADAICGSNSHSYFSTVTQTPMPIKISCNNAIETKALLSTDFTAWSEMPKSFTAILSLEFGNHRCEAMKLSIWKLDWKRVKCYVNVEPWPIYASQRQRWTFTRHFGLRSNWLQYVAMLLHKRYIPHSKCLLRN